jgi:hypothetical protein
MVTQITALRSLILALILASLLLAACGTVVRPALAPTPAPTQAAAIASSQDAVKLTQVLDSMQVETHWLKGLSVDWMTGDPTGRHVPADDTHCSAFVAAAAYKLGVYILRPPEHKTKLLANAQNEWLNSQGESQGWERVENGLLAQEMANQGYLVVASYKNSNPTKSGHIAIVRPNDKNAETIKLQGPQIIQAGGTNYNSAPLIDGFKAHRTAFSKGQIQFFAHKLGLTSAN